MDNDTQKRFRRSQSNDLWNVETEEDVANYQSIAPEISQRRPTGIAFQIDGPLRIGQGEIEEEDEIGRLVLFTQRHARQTAGIFHRIVKTHRRRHLRVVRQFDVSTEYEPEMQRFTRHVQILRLGREFPLPRLRH